MAKRSFTTRLDEDVLAVAQRVADAERRSVTSVIEMAVLEYGAKRGIVPVAAQSSPCLFAEGDRVAHKLFGLGTVTEPPTAIVAPSDEPGGVVDAGWRVSVRWDDASRTPHSVKSEVLTKAVD